MHRPFPARPFPARLFPVRPFPAKIAALGLCAITLSGCSGLDPELRQGEWRPCGANTANLVAMVANPADLSRGAGAANADSQEATAAVIRLRANKLKALPDSGLAEVHLQSNGGGGS